MPKCADCGEEASPSNVLFGGYGKLVCGDCLFKLWDKLKEKPMATSFKEGFEFVISISENVASLKRKNGKLCSCPWNHTCCDSLCPHFVIENCNIVDKKCNLILTCGKHLARVVEII